MKRFSSFALALGALFFVGTKPARAGFLVGAQLHPANFFILPGNTGLSTNSNFGTGALLVGFSASGYVDVEAFLAHDNTGTFQGTGTLFGSTGTFTGKFKVLSYGLEMKLSPPALPLFFKAGFGLCNMTSETQFIVAGVPVADPFGGLEAAFELHGGLGLAFRLPLFTLFGGLDALYIKVKSGTTSTTANLSGFVYFRPNVGVSFSI